MFGNYRVVRGDNLHAYYACRALCLVFSVPTPHVARFTELLHQLDHHEARQTIAAAIQAELGDNQMLTQPGALTEPWQARRLARLVDQISAMHCAARWGHVKNQGRPLQLHAVRDEQDPPGVAVKLIDDQDRQTILSLRWTFQQGGTETELELIKDYCAQAAQRLMPTRVHFDLRAV